MNHKKIGVIGYTGEIGKIVVKYLKGRYMLRLGSRHVNEIQKEEDIEYMMVDADNQNSIEVFCDGCDLIINTAGPSYLVKDNIAKVIADKRQMYIDAFGGNILSNLIKKNHYANNSVMVISAGVFPGLTGILLKWLSNKMQNTNIISAYVGGQERCSWTATMDLLLSTKYGFGISNACLKDAKVVKNEINNSNNSIEIPGIEYPVFVQKFLSCEVLRIANEKGLKNIDWHTIIADKVIYDNLIEAYMKIAYTEDLEEIKKIAQDLSGISSMNINKLRSWYLIIMELEGAIDHEFKRKRLLIRSKSSSAISGIVIGKIADHILLNEMSTGLYFPDELIQGNDMIGELQRQKVITNYQWIDVPTRIDGKEEYEEGEL